MSVGSSDTAWSSHPAPCNGHRGHGSGLCKALHRWGHPPVPSKLLPSIYRRGTVPRTSGKYMSDWPLGSHSRPHSRQAPARLLQRSFFTRRTLRPFGVCFRSWTSKMDTLPLPPCECEQRGFPGNLAFPQNPTETVGAWLRGSRGPSLAMLPSSARPNEYFSGVLVQIPAGQVSCRVRCQPCTVASARTQTGNSQLICCPYLLPAM